MNRTRTSTLDAFGLRDQRNRIFPALSASDGSTLDLDFTTMGGVLDSRFTFSRTSNATYINSSGYVATMAAAATNDPTKARFDYDPTTLVPKGLLIEGSATNLQRYSATFQTTGSYWYSTAGSMTAGVLSDAPDLGTPQIFSEPASGTGVGLWQISGAGAGLAASTTYTVSFWARAGTRSKVMWRCDGGGKDVGFNLSNGVATVVAGTFTNTKMTAYPNGWYRCEATWANVNASGYPGIYTATGTGTTYTISYTCNGSSVDLWGFQLETGTGASSYIPTVASQVSRVADECYMADISGFNYSNTNGTITTQLVYTKQASGYIEQIGFMTAGDQPTIEIFLNPSTSLYTAARGASLNTNGANETGATITLNTLVKYAVSVNVVTDPIVQINMNGTAASTTKSGTGTSLYTATRFVFGRLPASSYGSNFGSLTIKSVKYWPITKTATELAALTA